MKVVLIEKVCTEKQISPLRLNIDSSRYPHLRKKGQNKNSEELSGVRQMNIDEQ